MSAQVISGHRATYSVTLPAGHGANARFVVLKNVYPVIVEEITTRRNLATITDADDSATIRARHCSPPRALRARGQGSCNGELAGLREEIEGIP